MGLKEKQKPKRNKSSIPKKASKDLNIEQYLTSKLVLVSELGQNLLNE